jgi:hypothetical protein
MFLQVKANVAAGIRKSVYPIWERHRTVETRYAVCREEKKNQEELLFLVSVKTNVSYLSRFWRLCRLVFQQFERLLQL